MDDSIINNLFNNPITDSGKNDDFLLESARLTPAPEARVEQPSAGEAEQKGQHRLKLIEKLRESGRRRGKHEGDAPHTARKLDATRGQLADVAGNEVAQDKIDADIQKTKRTGRMIKQLGEFTKKFTDNGGEVLFKNVLPVLGGVAVALASEYYAQSGHAMSEMAAYVPDAMKGVIAAVIEEENRLVTKAIEARRRKKEKEEASHAADEVPATEEDAKKPKEDSKKSKREKIKEKVLQLTDSAVAVAIAAGAFHLFGEAESLAQGAEAGFKAAGLLLEASAKHIEEPIAEAIRKRIKGGGNTTSATQAELNAAGMIEPIDNSEDNHVQNREIENQGKETISSDPIPREAHLPFHIIDRTKRIKNRIKRDTHSRHETSRPPVGPGRYREARTARRKEEARLRRQARRTASSASSGESVTATH